MALSAPMSSGEGTIGARSGPMNWLAMPAKDTSTIQAATAKAAARELRSAGGRPTA